MRLVEVEGTQAIVQIKALSIPQYIDSSVYNNLLNIVSDFKRDRIGRFVKKEDAYRSLLSDVLVRLYIASKIDRTPDEIVFLYNSFGKPYVDYNFGIHFNVSHSGRWIVCAFAGYPVGIDIEEIKPIDLLGIGKRIFSDAENQIIKESCRPLHDFYELWSLKESYVKAVGTGLTKEFKSFTISKIANSCSVVLDQAEFGSYYAKTLEFDVKYKCAVCMSSIFKEDLQIVDTNDLIKKLSY